MPSSNSEMMTTPISRRGLPLGVLLALAVATTGCGSGADDLADARRFGDIDAQLDANVDAQRGAHVDATADITIDARADAALQFSFDANVDATLIVPDGHADSRDDARRSADATLSVNVDAKLSPDAYVASCGNGIVDTGEQCDDGNSNNNDGCLNNCQFATCGDGVVETGVEVCDDGTNGPGTCCAADCSAHLTCAGGGINFTTGAIAGSLLWNGAPITNAIAMYVENNSLGYAAVSSDGSYSFSPVAADSYDVVVYNDERCDDNPYNQVGQGAAPIVVTGGATTAADIDITNSAGFFTGTITVNGVPLSTGSVAITAIACGGATTDTSGNFREYVAPGEYTANVESSNNTVLGSFNFSITAGQTTDMGTLDFTPGAIAGSVIWNGAPITNAISMYVENNNLGYAAVSSDGSYSFAPVAAGSYDVVVYNDERCDDNPYNQVGQGAAPIAVTSGATTTGANIDITDSAGLLTGTITVNGVPLSGGSVAITSIACGGATTDTSGTFREYVAPGEYTANVESSNNTVLGSFNFSITAGQTTDMGTLDFTPGAIAGAVIWNGVPITNAISMYVENDSLGYAAVSSDGSYSFAPVAAGSYDVVVYNDERCDDNPYNQVGQGAAPIVVNGGATTTGADIDITDSAGLLTGTITVNGVPLSGGSVAVTAIACGGAPTDGSGNFHEYFSPGNYTANVENSNNSVIGSFNFSITAGQSTEYDSVVTNTGSNVSNAAAGGTSTLGGIELIFPSVSVEGTTTVIVSGNGPTAPNGFSIVGLDGAPRYWDVSTTAVFTGSLEVCVQYDPTQLDGDIGSLALVDASNGFADITTSVNTTTNVVCGTTATTSTFAVIDQPL